MVSVLAIGSKVFGFKPCRRDGFLRPIQVRSAPSFGGEVKPEAACHNILLYEYERNISYTKSIVSFSQILPICY
jgi:hypothetical protein